MQTWNALKPFPLPSGPQVDYLSSIGLQQDQICNMASISVVLLGVNPDTRLRPIVEYLAKRGVPKGEIPDVVLKNPRIFEYKVGGVWWWWW